ncbi:MAG TPA: glycoside hydrolase family 25 protein [Pyrinomonadaceae bacterium]|jgi:lysozyme|nr:glycoside hydrolase family 25 protein [Pyrinomonadaceae bacterium]
MSQQPQSQSARVTGIDVSHYQGSIEWAQVKNAGVGFAFAKATEGAGDVDPLFASHWNLMKEVGLVRGAYHFFHASQDAVAQANHFTQTVRLEAGDLPPVIDLELNDGVGNSQLVAGVRAWLETVEAATNRTPIIYTMSSFWNAHMTNEFGGYPLWIAHYNVEPQPLPSGWTNWTFWQYSQSLAISGVHGNVDHDYFNGSAAALQTFIAQSVKSAAPSGSSPA